MAQPRRALSSTLPAGFFFVPASPPQVPTELNQGDPAAGAAGGRGGSLGPSRAGEAFFGAGTGIKGLMNYAAYPLHCALTPFRARSKLRRFVLMIRWGLSFAPQAPQERDLGQPSAGHWAS